MNIINQIKFISSDIKKDNNSEQLEPITIDLDSADLETKLTPFYRFINKILDTENLVILAGSGTSLTFNKPHSDPIAPSMENLWQSCKNKDQKLFESVLRATNYHSLPDEKYTNQESKPDIELLLSRCDAFLTVGTLSSQQTKDVETFLDTAKKTILLKTNFTENVTNTDDWNSHNKFIRAVGRRSVQQQRLKLFTTNYDLAFEQAASNVGFIVIDGFEFSNPSYFNPMWFNYDIVNRSHTKSSEGIYIPNVLQLYKMHGSVDWRTINGRVKKVGADNTNDKPVFIYPSSSKYQTSYDSPYLDMMTSFLDVVKRPQTAVLCLGFGFNDKHINNALEMALRTNPEFMLMVATKAPFDPSGSFNHRIQKLLMTAISSGDGRIAMVDSTFEQFSKLLPERRSSTPEDEFFKAFEQLTTCMK